MQNPKRIRIQRFKESRITIIEALGSIGNIHVRITSRLSPQQRRAIAITFFRQIKPWLQYFQGFRLSHFEDYPPNFFRDEKRGLFFPNGEDFNSGPAKIGFQIRMHRLENGLTQKDLASKAGLHHTQLSEIERGTCIPRKKTLKKLESALGLSLQKEESSDRALQSKGRGLTA